MEDLRNLSGKEVEDFLKRYWKTDEFSFYGVFEPNVENPENFCGTLSKVKVPGGKFMLKYPFINNGYVSFKIPGNQKLTGKFYKFSCRLLPNFTNRCQLQVLLNTLEEIDSREYYSVGNTYQPKPQVEEPKFLTYKPLNKEKTLSPVGRRFSILEDDETGWGSNIRQLIGIYKQHDGKYYLDDIRKSDLTPLHTYPKTTFKVGPLELQHPIEGMEEGQYCMFNWRFSFKVKINPCEIVVDETKPIIFITPKDFMELVEKAYDREVVDNQKEEEQAAEIQSDVCVLLYDLLFEANRFAGEPTDSQFSLTDKYISFQHTGRSLSAQTILSLCGLGQRDYDGSYDMIRFHCKGLREFLASNDHTIIISNGFFLRFDHDGGRLKAVWIDKEDLPREIKISIARNKRFNETIILPFADGDKSTPNNYKVGLHCVFDDEQNIAFFQNIGKVMVKIKGGKTKTLDRKDWIVSREYQTFLPKEIRNKLNAKYSAEKKHTSIVFACRHKGNVLVGEEDAPTYCMLPTTTSFGFPFLMNMDIRINKTNYTINHKDSWNKIYAESAGRLFAKWITELTQRGEYTPKSIYGIVPKFDHCIETHPEEKAFITLFQQGFKDIILSEKDDNNEKQPKDALYINNVYNAKDANSKPNNTQSQRNGGGKLYVIDTNIFVNCPDIISKMKPQDRVILSAKVVDELDNLKYKMEDKDLRNVQMALKNINQALDKDNVSMEMSDVRLLPRDFDRHNPDNNILSVVIRHKAESPILLTSDNGLQIKAKALGISVIGLKEFLN